MRTDCKPLVCGCRVTHLMNNPSRPGLLGCVTLEAMLLRFWVMSVFMIIPKAQALPPPPPSCPGCLAPTDEIQVYGASITAVGKWNLTGR
jgi:hypothetical protein